MEAALKIMFLSAFIAAAQDFKYNEYKLDLGLVKENEKSSSLYLADKKIPVLKKEKPLAMSM